ncbi:integrase [Pandoraea horticolens]|uniref:Integrase n=1 Tax=Pandoraea horticolens TaxID=2508298 RepID=A0A5E4XYM4_9BURK|nr:integrase [Pandoraea horticolens]
MASISKRGNYWRAFVRRKDYPAQSRTFDTKAEAEMWARQVEAEIDRGGGVDRSQARRHTLKDLFQRYAKEVSPQKKGGSLEILRLRKLKTDPIAQVKIADLGGHNIARYRDRRLTGTGDAKPVSGSTVNRELTLIGHVLSVAQKEWAIPIEINPVSQIRRPKENRARSRRLRPGEEERLLAELSLGSRSENGTFEAGGSRNEFLRPIVILAIETAMRRSEMLSLRWGDVHLPERYARLHDSKNGEARDVPLSTRAIQTLELLSAHGVTPNSPVFPISVESLKKAFVRACERARIEDLHFHTTFATRQRHASPSDWTMYLNSLRLLAIGRYKCCDATTILGPRT